MRARCVLVGLGIGLAVGLLFLIQFLGWVNWFPGEILMALHMPVILIGNWLLGDDPFLAGVILQWLLLGGIGGVVVHDIRRSSKGP